MELKIRNGAYIADGIGGERRADGAEALLERALFRLSVRRGSFPFLPELGSELYRLGHEKPSARAAAAKLYTAAALAEETALTVEDVPAPEVLSLLLNSLYAMDALGKSPKLCKPVFELKMMALSGFEPDLTCCTVCGGEPEEPRLHLKQGALHCSGCRAALGEGISMPLDAACLAAMRHVLYGDPKRLFAFRLAEESLNRMSAACEAYVLTQLERGFRTLDFYKSVRCMNEPS